MLDFGPRVLLLDLQVVVGAPDEMGLEEGSVCVMATTLDTVLGATWQVLVRRLARRR